tara:strand:- start:605 stop:1027 length:423 start_codon:yes stop_codon:yes gene_type:complete
MSPLESIKKGILNNDMEEIIQGYMALTGEEVRPEDGVPEVSKPAPVQMQKSGEMDFSTKPAKRDNKRLASKSPVQADGNTFVDDGADHKDVVTPEYTPSPRKREGSTTVKVQCHVCGKESEVNPILAQGQFFRCDSCVGG